MNDLLKGYSSNFAAKRKKFKMKFRSKKDSQQSITILSKHWGKSRGEYSFLPNIKSSEPLPRKLEYDSHLVVNRLILINKILINLELLCRNTGLVNIIFVYPDHLKYGLKIKLELQLIIYLII